MLSDSAVTVRVPIFLLDYLQTAIILVLYYVESFFLTHNCKTMTKNLIVSFLRY